MEGVDEWWLFSAGMLVCAAVSEVSQRRFCRFNCSLFRCFIAFPLTVALGLQSSVAAMLKCSVLPAAALLPKVLPLQQYVSISPTVAVGAAVGLYFLLTQAFGGRGRGRRMSFMTDTLVGGPFPARVEAPDPIIGTVLLFDKLPAVGT